MTFGRVFLAVIFVVAGVLHFVATPVYMKIVPPFLPDPRLLVQISGVCEILGGIGLLLPATQRFAAWGLVILLFAVLPANVYMAVNHSAWPKIPIWALWARVPLQFPAMFWAWLYTRYALN